MSPGHFLTLDAPIGAEEVAHFLPTLEAALAGTGPAILPLPRAPSGQRQGLLDRARVDEPLEHPDTALLVPTSGSGGTPKIALLGRAALTASAEAAHEALAGPGRWVLCLPTTHIAGLQVLTRSIMSGFAPVTVDMSHGFRTDDLVDSIDQLLDGIGPEARYTALVPTQLHRALETGGAVVPALAALDAVLLGGSAAPPRLVERAHAAGITLVQTYGMTETCGGCVYDGVPLPGVHVTTDEEHRVQIAGSTLFSGYRDDPMNTRELLHENVFTTSDLGHFNKENRLVVEGRVDDIVVSGGVNVSCVEVQQVLAEHGDLVEVIVLGIDDDEWGQRVVVVAVATTPVSLNLVRSFGAASLPSEALPRQLLLVDEFPRLASGKPDIVEIKKLVSRSDAPIRHG